MGVRPAPGSIHNEFFGSLHVAICRLFSQTSLMGHQVDSSHTLKIQGFFAFFTQQSREIVLLSDTELFSLRAYRRKVSKKGAEQRVVRATHSAFLLFYRDSRFRLR